MSIFTPVRPDVFTEIGKREKTSTIIRGPDKDNYRKEVRCISTSWLGLGPVPASFVSNNKATLKALVESDQYTRLLGQLVPGPTPAYVETPPPPPPKRKAAQADVSSVLKRARVEEDNIDMAEPPVPVYPQIIQNWYQFCQTQHNQGLINKIPRQFTQLLALPPLDAFMQSEAGDSIAKFADFQRAMFL